MQRSLRRQLPIDGLVKVNKRHRRWGLVLHWIALSRWILNLQSREGYRGAPGAPWPDRQWKVLVLGLECLHAVPETCQVTVLGLASSSWPIWCGESGTDVEMGSGIVP